MGWGLALLPALLPLSSEGEWLGLLSCLLPLGPHGQVEGRVFLLLAAVRLLRDPAGHVQRGGGAVVQGDLRDLHPVHCVATAGHVVVRVKWLPPRLLLLNGEASRNVGNAWQAWTGIS